MIFLTQGLQRGLRLSLMSIVAVVLPYVESGYWVSGYAKGD
jgi:hypothetical protein